MTGATTVIQDVAIYTPLDDGGERWIERGYIEIVDGTIAAIREGAWRGKADDVRFIEGHGRTALPGFINTHTHTNLGLYPGLWDRRRQVRTAEAPTWAAQVVPPYTSYMSPADHRYANYLIDTHRSNPLRKFFIGAHSPYSCPPEQIREAHAAATQHQVDFNIHLAESPHEIRVVRERHGTTPVRFLAELGVLDQRVIANHVIIVDPDEIDLLAVSGARIASCPFGAAKTAGVAPLTEYLARGIPVGLGLTRDRQPVCMCCVGCARCKQGGVVINSARSSDRGAVATNGIRYGALATAVEPESQKVLMRSFMVGFNWSQEAASARIRTTMMVLTCWFGSSASPPG